jgi:hypothetical protein
MSWLVEHETFNFLNDKEKSEIMKKGEFEESIIEVFSKKSIL